MNAAEVRSLLPWDHPFVLVDRMVECVPHQKIVTQKRVPVGEPMAPRTDAGVGHLPAVLVLEGLSQSAALLFQLSYGRIVPPRVPLLGELRAGLHADARPGDTIIYTVHAVKMTSVSGLFRGTAEVDGAAIVEAELAFAVPETSP